MPMAIGLHGLCDRCLLFFVSILFLIISVSVKECYAQLKFDNLQPFELEISDVTDLSRSNFWRLSPADMDIGRLFGIIDPAKFPVAEGHFIVSEAEGTFLGYRNNDTSGKQILKFRIENQSDRMIDHIEISLALAILADGEQPSEISLNYQLDHYSGQKRLFRSNQLQNRSTGWETTSLTAIIENLLMETGDKIEIELVAKGVENFDTADAVGVQRIVLIPSEIELNQELSVGDLIISEIFPGNRIDGEPLHYLEMYNSTDEKLDLRGLMIDNGTEEFRIRESFELEPYQMAVVANRAIDQFDFDPEILLPGFRLPSHGGMVELYSNQQMIMRAAYDEQRDARSWEIERMEEALSGYISMTNFKASEQPIATGVYGSPGEQGGTLRVFTRKINRDRSWEIVGAPGLLRNNLNRENSYHSNAIVPSENGRTFSAGSGVLFKHNQSQNELQPDRLVAVEPSFSPESEIRLTDDSENKLLLLGNPFPESITLSNIHVNGGSLNFYSAQLYDPVTGSFRLISSDDEIEPWQAFVIQNIDAESIRFSRNQLRDSRSPGGSDYRTRSIQFELRSSISSSDRNSLLIDSAAMLHLDEYSGQGNNQFQAGKLWPVFQHQNDVQASILYFIGQDNNSYKPLARISRPYQPENRFTVTIGHAALNVFGPKTMTWDEWYNIPDDWEIILEDLNTGTVIDMREQNEYTFETGTALRNLPEFSDLPSLHPVEFQENTERFILSVNPAPHLTNQEEDGSTGPEKVELYQNYPNPFNPATNIRFYIPEQQNVIVGIYNVVGQRVALLLDDVMPQGEHTVVWDATEMPSGIYIINLELGNRVLTRKMTLIK